MKRRIKRATERPGTLIPVFFLSVFQITNAQYLPPGTESAGLAGCYTNLEGASAVAGNQAGLGWPDPGSVSVEYAMPFNVSELGAASLTASFPLYTGHIAGKLTTQGIPGYRHRTLWISYGLRLGEKICAGTGLFYNLVSTKTDQSHLFIASFAGGMQFRINDQIIIGGHLQFPLQYNSSGNRNSRLPSQISVGCHYCFSGENLLFLESRLNEKAKPAVAGGFESSVGDLLSLRGGILSDPATFSFGTSFRFLGFEIEFASCLIFNFGTSSFIGINYEF